MEIAKNTPLVKFPPAEMLSLVKSFTSDKIASFLDVTDLKADTQVPKMEKMATWAKDLQCASVCVNPVEVDILPKLLQGSHVKECYVIDFPLGKADIDMKAYLTAETVRKSRQLRNEGKGKIELDMVINVGRFKRDKAYTLEEINAVCEAADGEHVKVIIRSGELTEEELYDVSEIVAKSNAHFIKNSTGMDAYGAFPEHIRIMRDVVGNDMGVKAAGGISDALTVMRLFFAGAKDEKLHDPNLFRLGTSSPLNILSSFYWLKEHTEDWLQSGIVPCTICPYLHTSKVRREIRERSNKRCQMCEYKDYLKHKDF